MTKRALITGITGQDGSYLAELLLSKGYEVHGTVRSVAAENRSERFSRISHIQDKLHLHHATLESYPSLLNVVGLVKPDELYHLAAQSYVVSSFEDAFSTMNQNAVGTHYVLEAVRRLCPDCRVYFAASSEMFGNAARSPQDETTRLMPRSPYGVSKLTGFHLTKNYREAFGLHASSGILFNHESPRRGHDFVTRKITRAVAAIAHGKQSTLELGNLDARRDWGFAGDYVEAMWLMLQQDMPWDYVVATGESHSVREFCQVAFACVNLNWEEFVVSKDEYHRPAEIHELRGNANLARTKLGWSPHYTFNDLVARMVAHDMGLYQ